MKIDQLLSFRCVADDRSYTRAAERLFLTQPAVYSQVRQLEMECSAKLFYVHGKEVLLTPAGRELYAFASTVAGAFDDYRTRERARVEQTTHRVRIGALSYFGNVSKATERLRAEDPSVSVEFQSRHPGEAVDLLRAGEIDFGFFGSAFDAEGFVYETVSINQIIAIAPQGHPLAGRDLSFDELSAFPLIGYAGGSARMAIEEWLKRNPEHRVSYSAQTDSSLAAKTLALAMNAPAFIVKQAITEDLAAGTVVELRVRDFAASYPLNAVYTSEEELGASARRFLAILREQFAAATNIPAQDVVARQ